MDVHTGPSPREKSQVSLRFSPFVPFVAYLVLFFGLWTSWVYLIYPPMQALGTGTLAYALANITMRLLLWVLPVFLYLRYVDRVNPIAYLKLNQYWKRGVLIGLAISVLNFAGMLVRFGPPHPSMSYVTWNSVLGTSILVGFIEEIPFRGFILQKFQKVFPFWIANLLSSLLFLGIHLPGWVMLHAFTWSNAITIFVIGALLAVIFHYSRSLWSSIVTHSLNDFLSAVLFHLS
jgi:uncharacterized protein